MKKAGDSLEGFRFKWQRHRRILFLIVIILIAFNSSLYLRQRSEWIGADNANLEAKEYFVAGQVVFFHRKLASVFFGHPDRFNILVPLNLLQRTIYNLGVSKLPEEDGEKGVWADLWFVYIYSKNNELPHNIFSDRELGYEQFKGINGEIVTDEDALLGKTPLLPKKNKYMDLVWFCLETMATKHFADPKIEEFHYLRNFAGEAQYYAYNAPRSYTKMYKNSRRFYAQMPELTARDEKLAVWLRDLPDKWQQSNKVTAFIQKKPKVDAMRQMGLIMTLVNVFDARIWARHFDCSDKYLGYLRDARREFVDGRGNSPPSWDQMQNKQTAKMFYEIAINSDIARFTNFITEKKCGDPLPGEEDMREFQGESISPRDARKMVLRNLFPYELRLMGMTDVLEEKYWTKTVHGYEWR
ncbi:hypothetical protein [Desulfofustis glycolicus]|nr:hypothetical protein [Desulfofustis glycolicus]